MTTQNLQIKELLYYREEIKQSEHYRYMKLIEEQAVNNLLAYFDKLIAAKPDKPSVTWDSFFDPTYGEKEISVLIGLLSYNDLDTYSTKFSDKCYQLGQLLDECRLAAPIKHFGTNSTDDPTEYDYSTISDLEDFTSYIGKVEDLLTQEYLLRLESKLDAHSTL